MTKPLAIRSATLADEAEVAALWRDCELVTSYNDPGSDFRFALGKPGSDILVAVDSKGAIRGSVMIGHDGHRGWIYYVAAHPSVRNQGVGRLMTDAAERWLEKKGIVKAMLLVRETNAKVIGFYEHLGYESIPRTIMQKWLKKA